AIPLNIGLRCNELQDDPSRLDDWCERPGDQATIADQTFQIGYIEKLSDATDTVGSRWAVVVRGTVPDFSAGGGLEIWRDDGHHTGRISFNHDQLSTDPTRPSAIIVQLAMDAADDEATLTAAGIPGDPLAIQFGDANRNGVYGDEIGARLIKPGEPEHSYIIK